MQLTEAYGSRFNALSKVCCSATRLDSVVPENLMRCCKTHDVSIRYFKILMTMGIAKIGVSLAYEINDHHEISLKLGSSGITAAFPSEEIIKFIQLEENELHTPVRVQLFRWFRDDNVLEIRNDIDISSMDDTKVVMRFQTRLQSSDTFYTDLNGLEMIKRERFSKIPLQANYYPIPSAIYIKDDSTRLTIQHFLNGKQLLTLKRIKRIYCRSKVPTYHS
uniref:Glycosyl hydrolase family 38 C-terminal domain-containing protein n=1 Tax=Glossina pallidipes TaxID=7398 RepID=A0A1B0A8Q8_GLOPL